VIDALDDAAVNEYIDSIVKPTGSIDIMFNAVGPLANEYGNGKNAADLAIEIHGAKKPADRQDCEP
jgi:hypothetical protein